jgi:hypothetical protein
MSDYVSFPFQFENKHSVKVVSRYDVTKMARFDVRVDCKQPHCLATRLFRVALPLVANRINTTKLSDEGLS